MNNIIVYSTKACPYCVMAKEYFKSKKIDFEDVDVSADMTRAMEMIKKSGQQGVPVLDVNDQIIIGFNKPAIEAALK